MKPSVATSAAIAMSLFALVAGPAAAQQAAPPPAPVRPAPPPDPRLLAAQQAFEALPEAERRAIQQDLGFATAFNGAALGTFGALTFNGIQAFERENKLTVDGILSPPERQQLAAVAANARRALRFAILDDARSGVKIGVPQNVFTRRDVNANGGSRWQTADAKATLDTVALPKGGETLQEMFDKATAAAPGRKVTYKLLRPDFFVVTGETPTGKFYRRMTLAPDGAVRGFTIGYDKTLAKDMDRMVISVANSFDPFPGSAPAVAAGPSANQPQTPQTTSSAPRERLLTGLLLEGGHILTASAGVKDCKAFVAGLRRSPARQIAADEAAGLALLRGDGLPRPLPLSAASAGIGQGAALTAIAQAWSDGEPAGAYSEASPAGQGRVAAPLQNGGAGAALFDRSGGLAGVVTDDPGARLQIAGVVPTARYRFASPQQIDVFLRQHGLAPPQATANPAAGNVAAARRDAVIPVICAL